MSIALPVSSVALAKSTPPDQCAALEKAGDSAIERDLRSPSERRRVFATFCLPTRHPKAARLLETALADRSSFVRRVAAESAARISPDLLRKYAADRDPYVRFWSLQVGGDDRAVTAVIDLFRATTDLYDGLPPSRDEWPPRDYAAIRAFEGPSTEPLDLGHWARAWPPGTARYGRVRLNRFIETQLHWLGGARDQRAIAPLLKFLGQPPARKRWLFLSAIVESLSRLITPSPETPEARAAVQSIARVLGITDMNMRARDMAVELLARWQALESIPILVQLLDHEEEWTREDAARALGRMKAKEAIAPLIEHLGRIRMASQALAKLAPESIPLLIDALGTKVRWGAAAALAEIGPPAREAVPTLLGMVKNEEKDCIFLAAVESIEPGSARTVDAFLALLTSGTDCPSWVHLAGKINPVPASAITRVRALLQSPSEQTRKNAALVLGGFAAAAAPARSGQ